MIQTLAEWKVELAVISEPYRSINSCNWKADKTQLVAIYRNGNTASPPLRTQSNGQGFVAAERGGVNIVGVYAPPSWPITKFSQMLKEVDNYIQTFTEKNSIIIAGDFNAKSTTWGSKTDNSRGKILLDWSAGRDKKKIK